jgi:hypothetical protein
LSSGEEEEEDEVEAPPAPAPVQQKQSQAHGTKRLAAQQAAQTPQPAKKAKAEAQGKAPATAPAKLAAIARLDAAHAAKAQAGKDKKEVPAPTNEKEYVAALKAALQAADGPLKLATVRGGSGCGCGAARDRLVGRNELSCAVLLRLLMTATWTAASGGGDPSLPAWCQQLLPVIDPCAAGHESQAAPQPAQDQELHGEALCCVCLQQGKRHSGAQVMRRLSGAHRLCLLCGQG